MNYYFIYENGERKGPLTLEELKSKRILKTTLVWREGMDNWAEAHTVDELKELVIAEPPPMPTEPNNNEDGESEYKKDVLDIKKFKYDPTYTKAEGATIWGIIILIISIVFVLAARNEDPDPIFMGTIVPLINLIYRLIATIWTVVIADDQNRNKLGWGIFGFILPTLALIIIGLQNKKIKKVQLDHILSKQEKVAYCLDKANKYYRKERPFDSLVYLNEIAELDHGNTEMRKLRGKILYELKYYSDAYYQFKFLLEKGVEKNIANYYLGQIEILLNKNRERAVEHWLDIDKNSSVYKVTKSLLDLYHTFNGIYLLERVDLNKKIGTDYSFLHEYNYDLLYQKGLTEIDLMGEMINAKTGFHVHQNGVAFILQDPNDKKQNHIIGIAYHEIEDIILNENLKQLIISLTDCQKLFFKYLKTGIKSPLLKTEFRYNDTTGRSLTLDN